MQENNASKKTILLKLSGEFLSGSVNNETINSIVKQIKVLKSKCNLAIVIGAGNIFRGRKGNKELNLQKSTADEIGMLATLVNARMLQAVFEKVEIPSIIYSSIDCPKISEPISQNKINLAKKIGILPIFAGGTGNPFFSTDTNAILRGLQVEADEIWKATKVDGIYTEDPIKNPNAKSLKRISYDEFLAKKLDVMDLTAVTLAKENNVAIRVFDLFEENALIKAFTDPNFGSTIE